MQICSAFCVSFCTLVLVNQVNGVPLRVETRRPRSPLFFVFLGWPINTEICVTVHLKCLFHTDRHTQTPTHTSKLKQLTGAGCLIERKHEASFVSQILTVQSDVSIYTFVPVSKYFCTSKASAVKRPRHSSSGVSICTFVIAKQVNWVRMY